MKRWRLIHVLILFMTAFLSLSCGQEEAAPAYVRLSEGSLTPGDPLPVPEGTPILSVSGLIGRTNVDDHIEMDREMLESVGLVEYTVEDPFTDEVTTFEGVLMSDLLDLWEVDESATIVDVDALNDYQVDIPLELVRDFPVILALKADGEEMSVATRGPSMIVFPYGEYEFERPLADTYWVWQVRSMQLK